MALLRRKLLACGYLKEFELLNDEADYKFIIAIIAKYFKREFAKYFEEKSNKKFLKEMQFGAPFLSYSVRSG